MAAISMKDDFLTFADVSQEADYYDDWLFSSAKRYKQVNMYELDKSISALDWLCSQFKYLTVGTDEACNNDLLVYKLPLVDYDDPDRLSKNRELSIVAAVPCTAACHSLVAAPSTFKDGSVVLHTEHHSSKLFVHSLPTELDDSCIQSIQLLHTFDLFSSSLTTPPVSQFCGTRDIVCVNDRGLLVWCDVCNPRAVVSSNLESVLKEPISKLTSPDENTCIVSGANSGCTVMADKRTPSSCTTIIPASTDKGLSWSLCGINNSEIVLVNDNNELYMADLNVPGAVKVKCNLEGPIKTRRQTSISTQTHNELLSISGKDNKVRVFDLAKVKDGAVLSPLFVHDGHLAEQGGDMPYITTHSWHTSCPQIASATNTGQLHVWMFA